MVCALPLAEGLLMPQFALAEGLLMSQFPLAGFALPQSGYVRNSKVVDSSQLVINKTELSS